MTRAYPDRSSIFPGDTLILHVSSTSPQFKVEIYRQGKNLTLVHTTAWMAGYDLPEGPPDQAWGWFGYNIPTGALWQTGVYIAMLIEGDNNGNEVSRPDTTTADGRTAKALFVIKNPNPGKDACILYKVGLFTYHAYNAINEINTAGSLYINSVGKVSFHRPGGGTGGNPWDSFIPDEYDTTTPRQGFAHWDALFISWLEKNNYKVDYCTDLDIHENENNFLFRYRLVLSVGHDEYWSEPMRNNIENFIANYGNVAFFSGNTCWWRVHLEDGNTAIRCDKGSYPGDQWFNFNPENKLTGVSYRNGSGWWQGLREAVGYQVQHASHWVFKGTGLNEGDIFGAADHLVGYECDGCLFYEVGGFKFPTTSDSTPGNFLILGTGKLSTNWQDQQANNLTATMGLYNNNGIVFTAATTDWARVVYNGNAAAEQITHNVLKHLRTKTIRIYGPSFTLCATNKAVEGEKAVFHIDTSALMITTGTRYQWSVDGVEVPGKNKPLIEVVMPSPPVPITISVFVDDGTDCPAFGSLTIIPLTQSEAALQQLLCRLRMLVQHLYIPIVGIGEGKGPFVDPLYDPPKGERMNPVTAKQINSMLKESKLLVKQLENQLKNMK